jgi:diacylglycerol kinase family enzyme
MKVHCFQGRRVAISAATEQEMRLDGYEGGPTPAQIEILPGAIELVVPATP